MRLLTASHAFLVWNDYETVYVEANDKRHWKVGDFYGDPVAALITWDERWAVIVGEGALIVPLDALGDRPLKQVTLDTPDALGGAFEEAAALVPSVVLYRLFRGLSAKALWIEVVYQLHEDSVRFVADPLDDGAGIYQLQFEPLRVQRLFPPQE